MRKNANFDFDSLTNSRLLLNWSMAWINHVMRNEQIKSAGTPSRLNPIKLANECWLNCKLKNKKINKQKSTNDEK